MRKIVVYRAAHRLEQLGLIMASDRQPTSQGPAPGAAAGPAQPARPIADALADQIPAATGFDLVLPQWRYESVSATLRFLDALLATVPAPRPGYQHAGYGQ